MGGGAEGQPTPGAGEPTPEPTSWIAFELDFSCVIVVYALLNVVPSPRFITHGCNLSSWLEDKVVNFCDTLKKYPEKQYSFGGDEADHGP